MVANFSLEGIFEGAADVSAVNALEEGLSLVPSTHLRQLTTSRMKLSLPGI